MKKVNLISFVLSVAMFAVSAVVAGTVEAALTYGSGYYTNLCESGTSATYYSCNQGCSPATGSCQGENSGVVKWVCQGKWNQCLESESQWSNYEKLESVSCGYTVQLSLFDKKCRRIDGSWDNSCKLLGYMTWYSGDCYEGQTATPIPTRAVTVSPTSTPIPTATPVVSVAPSPIVTSRLSVPTPQISPTVTPIPAPGMCGKGCKLASDCKIGFACVAGSCRNPACPDDKACFCKVAGTASEAAILSKTPETGVETWIGMAGMFGLGYAGLKLRQAAKRVW